MCIECLDGEEALTFEGQVEWIAGGFDLSLAEIEAVSAEDAEAVYGLAYLRGGFRVLIDASGEDAAALADSIREVKERIGLCEVCFNLTDEARCRICQDSRRDNGVTSSLVPGLCLGTH